MALCEYGCGQVASFVVSSKKNCCSKTPSGCPSIKEKNRQGLRKAHKEGRAWTFKDEHRSKSVEVRRDVSAEKAFVDNSTATNETIKFLLFEHFNFEHKCQNCEITEWQGVKISLELDHINGNSRDNRIENLRLLCPNCHSITPTWRGKNINNGIKKVSDESLLTAFKKCGNIRQTLIEVGLTPKGANYERVKKILKK